MTLVRGECREESKRERLGEGRVGCAVRKEVAQELIGEPQAARREGAAPSRVRSQGRNRKGRRGEGAGRSAGPGHVRPGGHDRALEVILSAGKSPGVGEAEQSSTMI